MKTLIVTLCLFLLQPVLHAQTLQGDAMLALVGKPVSDPLFQQLKQQETFYTDAWDRNFTIYINRDNSNNITEVEFQNGKKKYSSSERYGYYKRTLPMQLSWSMTSSDFANKLGGPVLVSTAMNFSDYRRGDWKIRIFYEEDKPVSLSFTKAAPGTPSTPVTQPAVKQPVVAGDIKTGWLLKLDNGKAQFNWDVFSSVINNFYSLKRFAGSDSTDYIGQVYYNSKILMPGFERTAVKRVKSDGKWYFEAFVKKEADSNKARDLFFAVYDAIKGSVKSGIGDDFILAAVAKKPISESPVNWMAQWSLYSNYKGFVPGLKDVKMMWFVSGMKNAFKNDQMEYTFKLYIFDGKREVDFFIWDTPRS